MSDVKAFNQRLDAGFLDMLAYLDTLSPTAFVTRTDTAGWNVKDHIIHLAVWNDFAIALIDRAPLQAALGIGHATWATRDYDTVNALIQEQHANRSLDDVLGAYRDAHHRVAAHIAALSDADLQRPTSDYQPDWGGNRLLDEWLRPLTYDHYAQHRAWVVALLGNA